MIELAFVSASIIFAKVVNGPLVKMVILDPRSIDYTINFQTSSASGCLRCGKSVVRGAPNSTEYFAVYLQKQHGSKKEGECQQSYLWWVILGCFYLNPDPTD